MQIDSGLSGYGYSGRTYGVDRRTEEPAQSQPETRKRSASALTGSSTLLSSSLSNALWMVENARAGTDAADASSIHQAPAPSVAQVEDVYSEF
ncbi:hypothetical protein [Rhizobium sp. SGZ-381]|uniref:hypothetical protein n=1 Tax=Rhizobium sp. SGZ-381 TaxID=3342800 RepID=UPI00366B2F91